jgi:hypothetical protein
LAIFFFQVRSLKFLITDISDTGFGIFVLFLLWVNFILFNTKLKEKIKLDKINLPKPIISSVIGILFLLLSLLIINSSFVIGSINSIFERMLYPFGRARVGLTVAENAVPYFLEIVQNFGYLLWIFIIGIIAIFYEMVKHFSSNKSEKTIVNAIIGFLIISFVYIIFQIIFSQNYYNSGTIRGNVDYLIIFNLFIFLAGIVYSVIKNKIFLLLNSAFLFMLVSSLFSRFSGYQGVILNGESSFSKFLYLIGMVLFLFILFYIFIKAHIKKNEKTLQDFRDIDFIYALLLAFTFWEIVSMRGAIRLLFIVSPVIPLISGFLFTRILDYKDKNKENKTKKLASFTAISILIIIMLVTFVSYSAGTISSAKASVPGVYEQQWQKAMSWVRENIPQDSVFVHWWDYGYWVQTIGERPTVADGGHFIGYWPHLIGRYVLTTPYPETALSFMKSHNVSYLLIDSTDLGKYGAYSSIGSDEGGQDRLSQIPVMILDPAQTQEIADREIRIYQGGTFVDEDIIYDQENQQIFLPADKAVIAATMVEFSKKDGRFSFNRSYAIFIYNNQQINIPVRYLYFRGNLIDFGGGLDAVIMLIPSASSTGQNIQFDDLGAVIYLSPKVSRGLFAQLYLMNDPLKKYPTIKLAHSEPDFLISDLNSQGAGIGDFLYFNGFRGPIKIWKTDYPNNIIAREEFLRTTGGYGEFDNLTFIR